MLQWRELLDLASVDPRAWNLAVGVALTAAGCSARPVPGNSETGTSESTSTDSTSTDSTSTESTTIDTLETSDDGGPCDEHYDCCAPDWDCPMFQSCYIEGGYSWCIDIAQPPPLCGLLEIPTVLIPDAPPLALSFADVDGDGDDELVVATQTQLQVWSSGVPDPAVTVRDVPSTEVDAMVAGQFDDQPGDDIQLLVGDELHMYFADGVSGFANFQSAAVTLQQPTGLLALDADGQDPTDTLLWGGGGAQLWLGMGSMQIDASNSLDAAVLGPDTPWPSIALAGDSVRVYELTGMEAGQYPKSTAVVGAAWTASETRFVMTSIKDGWTLLPLLDPFAFWSVEESVYYGELSALGSGNFDGDAASDLIVLDSSGQASLWLDVLANDCRNDYDYGVGDALAVGFAIGDHDGDGDDEVALRFDSGEVALVDGE